ncbi:Nitrate/nitrite response regulator protein [Thioalkalivibrio nitratireducens DSM 14787]|uniref:Nitrate/nitrite response regulator protein n=1 Tax=Thioalkalivibrio nitratireducens (strain DSM 14787 / UNIQEM 213 / ALEN2) TaxID=1255043 RepID=L0DZC3_THIND|nr:response regulator [Thioalkalivibrio nitratireducens]AGA34352.1 Nitrate/nitrite response regulator protein [Thioalkalivibrio nitratireducens DSM 14787]
MTQRVLLIDDHTLFREGLQELLSRHGIETVGAVGDGETGIRLARELLPDVILLDMRMPTMSGLEVLRRLRQGGLQMPIVMLTTSTDESDLVECLRNGAQGYLLKEMEPSELVEALEQIIQGETVVAPRLAQLLVRALQGQPDAVEDDEPGPFDALTPREGEILSLLAEGQSNKVIARNLGISDGTVKLHVKAILRKLGVHSRVEAAVLAVQHGIGGTAH